jgi:hypothetical protein
MVNYNAKEYHIYQKMIRSSQRKNRPLIFVEGKFDHKVICSFFNTRKIDVEKISSSSENNKQSLIQLISGLSSDIVSTGIVDADYDWIYQRLYDEEILPYGRNIIDTAPHTDMNLILIESKGLEKYLSNEGLNKSQIQTVNDVSKWLGILRTLKNRYEKRNDCIVHIKLKDLRIEISKGFIPNNIQDLVEKCSTISPISSRRFFDDMDRFKRLSKLLNRYGKEGFEFYEITNGHDITAVMRGLGVNDYHCHMDNRLLKDIDREIVLQKNLFLKLRKWADMYSIDLI